MNAAPDNFHNKSIQKWGQPHFLIIHQVNTCIKLRKKRKKERKKKRKPVSVEEDYLMVTLQLVIHLRKNCTPKTRSMVVAIRETQKPYNTCWICTVCIHAYFFFFSYLGKKYLRRSILRRNDLLERFAFLESLECRQT